MVKIKLAPFFTKIIDILLALFLILNCQSMYQNSDAVNYHIYEITLALIVTSIIIRYLQYPIDKMKLNHIAVFSLIYYILAIFVLIACVSKSDLLSYSARFLFAPIILLYFVPICDLKNKFQVLIYFVIWTCIITAISLVFYIFGTNLGIMHSTGMFQYKWGLPHVVPSFYNLYFGNVQYVNGGFSNGLTYRNTAIFVEGPMYAAVLDLALYFLYLLKKYFKHFRLYAIILWLGIITSNSTAAMVIGIIVTFLTFKNTVAFKRVKEMAVVPLFIVLLVIIIDLINKKAGNFSQASSFGIRFDDYISGFKAWLSSPIFGWGYNNLKGINNFRVNVANGGYSNSLFAILNGGGIVFGLLYLIPIIYSLHSRNKMQVELACVYMFLLVLILFYTSYINFFIWALLLDKDIWLQLISKESGIKFD